MLRNVYVGKSGPSPNAPQDDNKRQARARINAEVRNGWRPHPGSLPCFDCGHIGNDRLHEYDHYLGYKAAHHYDVQAVCSSCHHARHTKNSCKRGHAFDEENTLVSNGARFCRKCIKLRLERKRGRPSRKYLQIKDWIGLRFGQLVIVSFIEYSGYMKRFLCQCDCGNKVIRFAHHLTDKACCGTNGRGHSKRRVL